MSTVIPAHEMRVHEVRANIVGFELSRSPPFLCGGLLFEPVGSAARFLGSRNATARVRFVLAADDWKHAVNLCQEGILRFASELLTFCQGSSVYFERISIDDGTRSFRLEWWRRRGKPFSGNPRVLNTKILGFLDKSMDVVLKPFFNNKTRIMEALYWMNETVVSPNVDEGIRFTAI